MIEMFQSIEKGIKALPPEIKSKLSHILEILNDYPDDFEQIRKYVVREEQGLYKIKINKVRIYFIFATNRVVLLHLFEKKSQKTPRRELQIARDKRKEALKIFSKS